MKVIRYVVCVVVLLLMLCTSCGLLGPTEFQAAKDALDSLRDSGTITQEQYAAMLQVFTSKFPDTYFEWSDLLWGVVTAGATYFGVQLRRGPADKAGKIQLQEAIKAGLKPEPVVSGVAMK